MREKNERVKRGLETFSKTPGASTGGSDREGAPRHSPLDRGGLPSKCMAVCSLNSEFSTVLITGKTHLNLPSIDLQLSAYYRARCSLLVARLA